MTRTTFFSSMVSKVHIFLRPPIFALGPFGQKSQSQSIFLIFQLRASYLGEYTKKIQHFIWLTSSHFYTTSKRRQVQSLASQR